MTGVAPDPLRGQPGQTPHRRSFGEAIDLIRERADRTLAEPADGFPHFADPATGAWQRTPAGDWTGGFWVGQLWLLAALTGEERLRQAARTWSARLSGRVGSQTIFRGFLFWYGAAHGAQLLGDPDAADLACAGAEALAGSFHPAAGLLPLGADAEEAHSVGAHQFNIDGVPGGAPLLCWAAEQRGLPRLRQVAVEHAARHASALVRPDGSVVQSGEFDPVTGAVTRTYTHKGLTDYSTWARAQAWAMLGLAQAARREPALLAAAVQVCDWWLEHLPGAKVPPWDFDAAMPGVLPDTSAAAIAAAALAKAASLPGLGQPRPARYREAAGQSVTALTAAHLTPVGDADPRPAGILADGCYNVRIGLATAHELVWGDYFLLEALLALTGVLPTDNL